MAAQVDDPLPATVAESGGRNICARAVTTVENEFVSGCPGNITHTGKQPRERDVHGAGHVACGKLALGTNVKNVLGLASINAFEEFHDRDRPVGIDPRR